MGWPCHWAFSFTWLAKAAVPTAVAAAFSLVRAVFVVMQRRKYSALTSCHGFFVREAQERWTGLFCLSVFFVYKDHQKKIAFDAGLPVGFSVAYPAKVFSFVKHL